MSLYNLLHGVNPLSGWYLAMLGLTKGSVPRFRDVFLEPRDDGFIIGVHTRMGGGNRGHWEYAEEAAGPDCECPSCRAQHVLARHPNYLYDEDDDFDCTYATYYFSVPERFKEAMADLSTLGGQQDVPSESWERLFAKLSDTDTDDEETRNALEVGRAILAPILDSFKDSGAEPSGAGRDET